MLNGNHQIRTSWQIMSASVYTLIIRNLELRFIMNGSNKRLIDLLIIFFEPVGHVLLWSAIKLTWLRLDMPKQRQVGLREVFCFSRHFSIKLSTLFQSIILHN